MALPEGFSVEKKDSFGGQLTHVRLGTQQRPLVKNRGIWTAINNLNLFWRFTRHDPLHDPRHGSPLSDTRDDVPTNIARANPAFIPEIVDRQTRLGKQPHLLINAE